MKVFSTCTFNPAENEANVAYAIKEFPLRLEPQGPFHFGDPGLAGFPGLSDEQLGMVQRFEPGSALALDGASRQRDVTKDTMGFFIAKFVKVATYSDDFT